VGDFAQNPRHLDQGDAIRFKAWGKLGAGSNRTAWSGGEFGDGSVVDGEVFVAVKPGWIPDAIELFGAMIGGQAGPLAKPMRTRAHSIGRHAEGDGVAATQINQIEARPDRDRDMDIVVQILGAQEQRARIAIPQVTNDGFEESNLECLTDIIDTEAAHRLFPRIGEPARREAEAQRIRKAVEEDMVPDTADGHVRRRQRCGRQRMREAGHQSGKGTGGGVLRGG
jgi:hypothetical protein